MSEYIDIISQIKEKKTDFYNIPEFIISKINKNLHNLENHPICIIKNLIYKYFASIPNKKFEMFDKLLPLVTTKDNFDLLCIPKTHPSRSKSDTYYVSEDFLLRTHMTAHQNEMLVNGKNNFLMTGNVFRKDQVDSCHHSVFHQMDGVSVVTKDIEPIEYLKDILGGLIKELFPNCEYRFNDDSFPFTRNSIEAEVKYNGKWLEILGGGIIVDEILYRNNIKDTMVAWGLGIERLAMILFKIPDIRLFWSENEKFTNQFSKDTINIYKPFSNLTSIKRDISFWINDDEIIKYNNDFNWSNINDFNTLVNDIFLDNIECIELYDKFYHKKNNKYSHTFCLTLSPNAEIKNGSVFNKLMNEQMLILQNSVENKLNVIVR